MKIQQMTQGVVLAIGLSSFSLSYTYGQERLLHNPVAAPLNGRRPGPPKSLVFPTSAEFKEIEKWVKGLCPEQTIFNSQSEQIGAEGEASALHNDLDYQSRKVFLMFALSEMEKTANAAGDNAATQNLKALIAEIRPKLLADKIPLATALMDGPTAAIVRTKDDATLPPSFMFGKEFLRRFFQSPHYYLGVLAHEFRHYSDLTNPDIGPDHDLVRYTCTHESRGHWQEAEYFRMLPAQIQNADPRIVEHALAAKDGENSAAWRAHLNEYQAEDFELRDEVEKMFYETAQNKRSDHFVVQDLKPLTERVVRTTADVIVLRDSLLEDPSQIKLQEQLRQKMATLQTFIKLQKGFQEDWKLHGPSQRDSEELTRIKASMANGFKLIAISNDLVVENQELRKMLSARKQSHTPNNPLAGAVSFRIDVAWQSAKLLTDRFAI